jgi:hypothetical protein
LHTGLSAQFEPPFLIRYNHQQHFLYETSRRWYSRQELLAAQDVLP